MNFIKSLLGNISLQNIFQRFPMAVMSSIIVTFIVWNEISDILSVSNEILLKTMLTGIIIYFLSVGVTLLAEGYQKKGIFKIFSQIGVLLFGALFFFSLGDGIESYDNIIYFAMTLVGSMSFIFFAPYIQKIISKGYSDQNYYQYFYSTFYIILKSAVVGGALALLGNIAIFTIQTLFDIGYSISGDLFGYWSSLVLLCVAPIFALSQIQDQKHIHKSETERHVFFTFLLSFIAFPAIVLYFCILYAYSLKVLLNFSDWPQGEVSWLVIGFSIFGYLVYIFSYIFQNQEKKNTLENYISKFRKIFPYLVIPQLGMLFYAIGLRIGQYDLTVNRYFVVIFGILLGIISVYYIFSREKKLVFIPLILTLTTLIFSMGPWSIYQLPLSRQIERLEQNLITANILQDTQIVPLENYTDISEDLSREIYSGIQYLCNYNDCEYIKNRFPDLDDTLNNWEIVSNITENIKVQNYYTHSFEDEFINFSNYESIFPLDISGYDIMLDGVDSYNRVFGISSNISASISIDDKVLMITEGDQSESIDISNIWTEIRENFSDDNYSFNLTSDKYDMKFILKHAIIYRDPLQKNTKEYNSENMSGILLLRQK